MSNLVPVELRRARASLFVIFLAQGGGFALLFSRLPTLKDRFELSDSALALLTLALPLLAGVATLVTPATSCAGSRVTSSCASRS